MMQYKLLSLLQARNGAPPQMRDAGHNALLSYCPRDCVPTTSLFATTPVHSESDPTVYATMGARLSVLLKKYH